MGNQRGRDKNALTPANLQPATEYSMNALHAVTSLEGNTLVIVFVTSLKNSVRQNFKPVLETNFLQTNLPFSWLLVKMLWLFSIYSCILELKTFQSKCWVQLHLPTRGTIRYKIGCPDQSCDITFVILFLVLIGGPNSAPVFTGIIKKKDSKSSKSISTNEHVWSI